jgi:hypothetical protein
VIAVRIRHQAYGWQCLFLALFGHAAMSDLSPEYEPKRTSTDHSEFMGSRLSQLWHIDPNQRDGSEMLDSVPHDPAIEEFVWQLALLLQIITAAFTDSSSEVWASLRWRSKYEIDDGVAHRLQAWLRRRPVHSFFPPLLLNHCRHTPAATL